MTLVVCDFPHPCQSPSNFALRLTVGPRLTSVPARLSLSYFIACALWWRGGPMGSLAARSPAGTLPRAAAGRRYYFRPGAAAGRLRWHIYLPGGAWCVTPADCAARAGTRLGSSKSFPANPAHYAAQLRPPFEGILSGSAQQNPALYQWNLVRLIYCDGGGYAGTRGALNVSLASPAAAAPRNASSAANSTGSTKSSAPSTAAIYLDGWNIIQAVIAGAAPPPRPRHCALRVPPWLCAVPCGSHAACSTSPPLFSLPPVSLLSFLSSSPPHLLASSSPRLLASSLPRLLASSPRPSCHADLVQKRKMRSASQVLLSGSSAGGQATVNLCDWLASSFPSASTRCLVDSGFFLANPSPHQPSLVQPPPPINPAPLPCHRHA
ncbi:unnamed protein product [Closterium sp. Naga37s-1]|nr:unnamed protein product [Closterium sp. Naga37s-1]